MARTISLLVAAALLMSCQREGARVGSYPPPSFEGPRIAQGPVVPLPMPPEKRQTAPPIDTQVRGDWMPVSAARDWRWIVIHHSATPAGSAAVFDQLHRDRGWDELGYHFVIGNGTDSGDGRVEVGPRWRTQKHGAHAKTEDNRFNDFGIGICLVGNFEIDRPTPAQIRALAELTAHLMRTYRIPSERVIGHSDTRPTDCPGRHMDLSLVRRMAAQIVAEGESPQDLTARSAAGELPAELHSH